MSISIFRSPQNENALPLKIARYGTLLPMVCDFLTIPETSALMQTCSDLEAACKTDDIWKSHLVRFWPGVNCRDIPAKEMARRFMTENGRKQSHFVDPGRQYHAYLIGDDFFYFKVESVDLGHLDGLQNFDVSFYRYNVKSKQDAIVAIPSGIDEIKSLVKVGNLLLFIGLNGRAVLYDPVTNEAIKNFNCPNHSIDYVTVTPDDRKLIINFLLSEGINGLEEEEEDEEEDFDVHLEDFAELPAEEILAEEDEELDMDIPDGMNVGRVHTIQIWDIEALRINSAVPMDGQIQFMAKVCYSTGVCVNSLCVDTITLGQRSVRIFSLSTTEQTHTFDREAYPCCSGDSLATLEDDRKRIIIRDLAKNTVKYVDLQSLAPYVHANWWGTHISLWKGRIIFQAAYLGSFIQFYKPFLTLDGTVRHSKRQPIEGRFVAIYDQDTGELVKQVTNLPEFSMCDLRRPWYYFAGEGLLLSNNQWFTPDGTKKVTLLSPKLVSHTTSISVKDSHFHQATLNSSSKYYLITDLDYNPIERWRKIADNLFESSDTGAKSANTRRKTLCNYFSMPEIDRLIIERMIFGLRKRLLRDDTWLQTDFNCRRLSSVIRDFLKYYAIPQAQLEQVERQLQKVDGEPAVSFAMAAYALLPQRVREKIDRLQRELIIEKKYGEEKFPRTWNCSILADAIGIYRSEMRSQTIAFDHASF